MQRTILGIMTIVFLLSAIVLLFTYPEAMGSMALAFCWRMGAVTLAAWLAYDDIQRLPNWLLVMLPVLLVVLARWPKLFLLSIPVLVVVGFLNSRLARR